MPGIFGAIFDIHARSDYKSTMTAMAYPLIFTPVQEVELFKHKWYLAGTVGYGKSFSFLKRSSAHNEDVLLIMDGEVFPDVEEVQPEFAKNAPTIQRAEYCLYLYLKYGANFVERLNGNFVIAVFDNRNHEVHLYNDRFGSEPIYIWSVDGEFAFSTSLRSLLSYKRDIGKKYDYDSVAELIVFERILGDKTLFQDIRRLTPASHTVMAVNHLLTDRYYHIGTSQNIAVINDWKDASIELNRTLKRSMGKRLADSGKTAALISGGLDSRLLLAHCPSSIIAATFSNKNQRHSIETRIAEKISSVLGHQHILIEREIDHYADVAEFAVAANEAQCVFVGCHSLGLHPQILNKGIQILLTAAWWDILFKGYYSVEDAKEFFYQDKPSILESRRIAWNLLNSGTVRKLHHQHLMMLALNKEMKHRIAVIKENLILKIANLLSKNECENPVEYFTLLDLQSDTGMGFQRAIRTTFIDRSPAYDNDLLALGLQIPLAWKKDGQIVRRALSLVNPKLGWIKDANTGLPAGLCPPWNRIVGNICQSVRNTAKRFARHSKSIDRLRQPASGCSVFLQNSSWHDINGLLRLSDKYRSMVEHTVENLDDTIFDKNVIRELLRDDLNAAAPRLNKLFEMILTFGLFDKEWGPFASRNFVAGTIRNMTYTDMEMLGKTG